MTPAQQLAALQLTRAATTELRTAERGWDYAADGTRQAGDPAGAALRAAQLTNRLLGLAEQRAPLPSTWRTMTLADHARFLHAAPLYSCPSAN